MSNINHLAWIVPAIALSFLVPFLFGNLKSLPVDIYYFIYFVVAISFFTFYINKTGLDLRKFFANRLALGVILGLVFALIMAKNVFSRAETDKLVGPILAWALAWRGLVYGAVDGLLLSSFPWVVVWRSFDVASRSFAGKVGFTMVAWALVVAITTAYHLGYKDFRSAKIIQPNIGNSIISLPTFLSANPIASPIAHAGMHVAAVLHSPGTDLFLPPHK